MLSNNDTYKTKVWARVFILCSALMGLGPVGAVGNDQAAASDQANRQSLDTFIEQEMQNKMKEFKVAGATLALVRGGELIYAKGFGDADANGGQKVDVEKTLFRWGSISKTITWTAIMQLVEQGKIDLEADVNDYLTDVSIPEAFDGPVRVKHLLAHTPGFEDAVLGHVFEKKPANVTTLKEYLIRYQPKRVRPAGQVFAYSNYGTALAGRIIENVSGMTFEDYVQLRIFKPLEMTSSTFLEPLPAGQFAAVMDRELHARLSKRFMAEEDGTRQDEALIFGTHVAPAGTLASPATDMVKFAQAHLDACARKEVQVLKPETCAQMHSVLEPLNAGGKDNNMHGFFQHFRVGGHNRVGHNGGIISFHSQMGLYPDLDFAFLMSTNTDTGAQLYRYMEEAIVKHLFGDNTVAPQPVEPPAGFIERGEKYTGYYMTTRRNYSSIEAIYSLFLSVTEISLDPDGYLLVHQGEETTKIVEVSPGLFRAVDADEYFEFIEDADGEVMYLKAMQSFDKVAWYQAPANQLLLLAANFLFLIIGILVLAIQSSKRFSGGENMLVTKIRRYLLASLSIWVFFIIAFIVSVGVLVPDGDIFTEFPSKLVILVLAIGVAACFVSLLPTWAAVQFWRGNASSSVTRCYYSALVIAIWLFAVQLNSFHIIGFNYLG